MWRRSKLSLQGPCFAPAHRAEFYAIVGERYNAARAEAAAIGAGKRIHMRIEFLKPVHIELTEYKLPVGDTTLTLEANCAFFPYGIISWDDGFDYMEWYEGKEVIYIGDWFTLPVNYFEERQGAYKGNLKHYEFRAGETFQFTVHSMTTPTPSTVDAWLLAFVVLPRTKAKDKIIR